MGGWGGVCVWPTRSTSGQHFLGEGSLSDRIGRQFFEQAEAFHLSVVEGILWSISLVSTELTAHMWVGDPALCIVAKSSSEVLVLHADESRRVLVRSGRAFAPSRTRSTLLRMYMDDDQQKSAKLSMTHKLLPGSLSENGETLSTLLSGSSSVTAAGFFRNWRAWS